MVKPPKMIAEENQVPLSAVGSTERKNVLAGADFVVLSFGERNLVR